MCHCRTPSPRDSISEYTLPAGTAAGGTGIPAFPVQHIHCIDSRSLGSGGIPYFPIYRNDSLSREVLYEPKTMNRDYDSIRPYTDQETSEALKE